MAIAIAAAVGLLLVTAAPAGAHAMGPWRWDQSPHQVGYCDLRYRSTGGGYIQWVQAFLWVDHDYYFNGNGSWNVDGNVGPNTDRAIRSYQAAYGLVQDGCAGYATFHRASNWDQLHYQYSYCCSADVYRYQTYWSEYVTFYMAGSVCWQTEWFDGRWQITHTWHQAGCVG